MENININIPEKEIDPKIRDSIYLWLIENGFEFKKSRRNNLRSLLKLLTKEYREDLDFIEKRNDNLQKEVIKLRKQIHDVPAVLEPSQSINK